MERSAHRGISSLFGKVARKAGTGTRLDGELYLPTRQSTKAFLVPSEEDDDEEDAGEMLDVGLEGAAGARGAATEG